MSSTKVVFLGRSEKQDGRPGLWLGLRHFLLLIWNRWTEFDETWQEIRYQCLLPSLCFSGRSEKQDDRPGLWLAETFSTSPLKPLNRIQRNLTGSKIPMSSTRFVFFGQKGKTVWPPWPLICWNIFQTPPLNALNGIQLNLTGSKISMSSSKFVFPDPSEKQDGHPSFWLADTLWTSQLKPLKGIQGNLSGSKISTSYTEFVILMMSIRKWPPRLICQKGCTFVSGARYMALWLLFIKLF